MKKEHFKSGVEIMSCNNLTFSDLEGILNKIPEKYGAYIDKRFKKNLWIFQKKNGLFSLQEFLENNLGILCISGGIHYEKEK